MKRNVAIFGKFLAGKTTLARELADNYGYQKVSLASNLKTAVMGAYGTIDKSAIVTVTNDKGEESDLYIRQILQKIGESVKDVDQHFWIRWFLNDTRWFTTPLAVDDGRLPAEAEALRREGWAIVKVETPDQIRMERHLSLYGRMPTEAELNHRTETSLDDIEYDYIIDGELDVELAADQLMFVMEQDEVSALSQDTGLVNVET